MSNEDKNTGLSGCLKLIAVQGSAIIGPLSVIAMLVLHFAKITVEKWVWCLLIAALVVSVVLFCIVMIPAFFRKDK